MTEGAKSIAPGACSQPLNVDEFEEYARRYLPKNAYDYYASGANDNQSLRENKDAFKRLRIMPRVMRDVSTIDMSCTVLGKRIEFPICAAPTAMHKMAHKDGEEGTARACAQAKTCMILSSLSSTALEQVAEASGNGLRWFQLYIYKDRALTAQVIQRAEASGYEAIVLTVDTPLLGRREADVRNRFALPSHLTLGNFDQTGGKHALVSKAEGNSGLAAYVASLFDQAISWKDVKWLKSITKLPVVVKGILSPEDARIAVQLGCEGVLVSNHGARQLDGVPATIEALKDVVKAVDGRAEVYMDGGIRRGTDVFKALALGARAVFIGRPLLWGLAQNGEHGVMEVLRILSSELQNAMMFSGVASVQEIGPEYLIREDYYRRSNL